MVRMVSIVRMVGLVRMVRVHVSELVFIFSKAPQNVETPRPTKQGAFGAYHAGGGTHACVLRVRCMVCLLRCSECHWSSWCEWSDCSGWYCSGRSSYAFLLHRASKLLRSADSISPNSNNCAKPIRRCRRALARRLRLIYVYIYQTN